ncbi:hypothetical protein St703_25340 [Sporolactobacillus terrae]|uniref:Uncharacterized protein n=1 Tax=Sporolactobacillus terrae TaxID=269673 RepID=A0A5K7X1E0_9BACL|nr:hypothetical protein St703_25340 [Sporolactobacillus terrae]
MRDVFVYSITENKKLHIELNVYVHYTINVISNQHDVQWILGERINEAFRSQERA